MRANLFFFLSTIPLFPLVFKSLQESLFKTICATQGMRPISPEYKISGAEEKVVLKQAVANLLSQVIVTRPKSGMMMHMQQWFRSVWRRQARSLLLNKKAAIAPCLNQSLIRDWLDYRGQVWSGYGVLLWSLVSL